MVDFKKHLKKGSINKPTDPLLLYESLDRASDKGELRTPQKEILSNWFNNYKTNKDVIIKLNTGKGKTLIGLLILQSKLNMGEGPCLYLCPDKYLVEQTCIEAKSFGIDYCTCDEELPIEFENGDKILITTVNKLFNGYSKFGLNAKYINVNSIILDDSHACLDIIKDCFSIKVNSNHNAYKEILALFDSALEEQGPGTFSEIVSGKIDAFLPVSYWSWENSHIEVTKILSKYSSDNEIKFNWPILKDNILNCSCVISGKSLEISPYLLPIDIFGSFYNAKHRIFMSATVNNDSFFIKHLNLDPEAIINPITYSKETWSGEKMILIPSLIDEELNRDVILEQFAALKPKKSGICILVPSSKFAKSWESYGSIIAERGAIGNLVKELKQGKIPGVIVFVNRYDGIDLPDDSCRILIFDGLPYSDSLSERYYESCLDDTEIINIKLAQKIEQGLGRHIRGEKDYGAVLILGQDLIYFLRSKKYQKYFSNQTKKQIEIGLKIIDFAKEDIEDKGKAPLNVLYDLIKQLLNRNENWKEFYLEEMNSIENEENNKILDALILQRNAESLFMQNKAQQAIDLLQSFINEKNPSEKEEAWYLQQMARYQNRVIKSNAIKLQQAAHSKNNFLLKPPEGMIFRRLASFQNTQSERIKSFLEKVESFQELLLQVNEIVANLEFGIDSEKFENSIKSFGEILGFPSERPDKQWKAGPDNLWQVSTNEYFVIECKNEVKLDRPTISKDETGQMNNACAWFKSCYKGSNSKNILIIPTKTIGAGAGFNEEVLIMRNKNLKLLKKNLVNFINEFSNQNLKDLNPTFIANLLKVHKLEPALFSIYLEEPKEVKFN